MQQAATRGVTILLAHGSSDQKWCDPFLDLERIVEKALEKNGHHNHVKLAFMELASPSLEAVVAIAVAEGVKQIQVLPLFFAAGRHLRQDVPAQITALETLYSGVSITLMPPVGEHPAMITALTHIITEVV